MPFIITALLLASVIGGAASIAAQSALPGDTLWHFKTGINERMQSALVPDGKVQANFDIGIIETRIQESKKISGDAERVAVVKSVMEKNIAAHATARSTRLPHCKTAATTSAPPTRRRACRPRSQKTPPRF